MTVFKAGQPVRNRVDGDTGIFLRYCFVPKGTLFVNTSQGPGRSKVDCDCEVLYSSNGRIFTEVSANLEPLYPEEVPHAESATA